MTLNEYQDQASTTMMYKEDMGMPLEVFCAIGLNEEAGEYAGKVKKYYRDRIPMGEFKVLAALELGDTLWYLANSAKLLGYSLSDIAQMNLDKLKSRRERGVIHGSGDNR